MVNVAKGARRIYGVVGDSLNPIVDAVRHTDGIEWVHVSNEEGGAFAAAAEAQVTGRLPEATSSTIRVPSTTRPPEASTPAGAGGVCHRLASSARRATCAASSR